MELYTAETARQIIENCKVKYESACMEVKGKRNTGILQTSKAFFRRIDRDAHIYGVRIVGTCLEDVMNSTDYKNRFLYYNFEPGSIDDQGQDEYIDEFIKNLEELSELYRADVRKMAEEERARIEETRRVRKNKKEELMKEYRRARKSLLQKARRHGVTVSNIQKPKRVTAGSVRKLVRMRGRIK